MAKHEFTKPNQNKIILDENIEYSVQVIRWFLKPFGVWPREIRTTNLRKLINKSKIVVCYLLIVSVIVPIILNVIFNKEPGAVVNSIGPLSFWIMATLKYYYLIIQTKDIGECIDHIEEDWQRLTNSADRDIMFRNVKSARFTIGFCLFFMHLSVFSYELVRGIPSDVVSMDNDSVVVHTVPLPFYNGLIDSRFSPVYEIVFTIQCVSSFVVNSITVSACCTATIFVMHACGQLQVIMSWLKHFTEVSKKHYNSTKKTLNVILDHHLRVLSFASRIENIMNRICFVEIVGCTMNMCMLGYYFIMEWERNEPKTSIALSILFSSITFNIFIFCYIGELLSEQCKLVGETAYMTTWYNLPKETALSFILIISRSNCLVRFTAGKLITLSIATFGDVIRTAMTYLNMLRTIT